jgi:DNA polymerase-4
LPALESRFGRYGVRLYELARGIDASDVVPDRPTQSISAEDTFEHDVPLSETDPMIRKLAELTWAASRKESRSREPVLKLKTAEFKILTRSHTPSSPPCFVRGIDGHHSFAARARYPRTAAAISSRRRRP